MKAKILKHKKLLIIASGIAIIAMIVIPLISESIAALNNVETVREREYTVKKDNITVGVESSGLIDTLPNMHSFAENTSIDEIFVKVGNEVKKGDKLATISLENLNELIQNAKDELSDSRASLLQAQSTKDVYLSQNDKNKKDSINNLNQEFALKLEVLNSEKKQVQKSIEDYELKIAELEKSIKALSPQVWQIENKISNLKSQINKNIIKIGKLNEDLLKIDDGSDKRNYLNQKIANAQSELQVLTTQLSEKLSLAENNKTLIEKLESDTKEKLQAITALEEQLNTTEDQAEKDKISKQIEALKNDINSNTTEINKLSYKNEIDGIKTKIATKENEIKSAQNDLLNLSYGSDEMNSIRLEITKLQNENTVLQQDIDKMLENPVVSELEKKKSDKTAYENALEKEYLALSLKIEDIQRNEKQFAQSLDKQNQDNAFADYKVGEEIKTMNENISKSNRNVLYAQEKLNKLLELEKNPTLYAQMDGIVTALNYKVGEITLEGKPFCVIGELSEITMTVPISAADIGGITIGQKVNIYVDAFAEQKFSGTVTERFLVANDNGDYAAKISVKPNECMLLPGMKAFATIILKEKNDILTISNKAIYLENGQQYVNVKKENGEIIKTKVTTGFSDGRISEVLDGLSENDVTVVKE